MQIRKLRKIHIFRVTFEFENTWLRYQRFISNAQENIILQKKTRLRLKRIRILSNNQ
jgi:hypothetical protein